MFFGYSRPCGESTSLTETDESELGTSDSCDNECTSNSSLSDSESQCGPLELMSGDEVESSTVMSHDLGEVVNSGRSLSETEKYQLLKAPFMPDRKYKFPQVADSSGHNRSFQWQWLEEYPGLVYSPQGEGGFCKYCALFSKEPNKLGVLVAHPLKNFRKAKEILNNPFIGKDGHGKLSHAVAMSDAVQFMKYMDNQVQPIDRMLSSVLAQQIAENRLKLKSILKTVILCGRRNFSLCGHRDDFTSDSSDKGNFDALLSFRADAGDMVLANHFETMSSRATYTSKTIQNELISVCGEYIQEQILKKISKQVILVFLLMKQLILQIQSNYQWLSDLLTMINLLMRNFWNLLLANLVLLVRCYWIQFLIPLRKNGSLIYRSSVARPMMAQEPWPARLEGWQQE